MSVILSRRPSSPISTTRLPHLPFELIWAIVEQTLLQLSHNARGKDISIVIPIHLITLNRVMHTLVLKLVYQTVILSSSRAVSKFLYFLTSCPNVANLVRNLWIGTARLEAFAHQVGWVPCAIKRILERARHIKRLALPAAFYPIGLNEVSLDHLTVNGGGFVGLLGKPNTLHIYGLAQTEVLRRSVEKDLGRVICEIKRPCAPGAIAHLIDELSGCGKVNLQLELVVGPGLETWLDEELVSVQGICSGVTVRTKVEVLDESPAEEWARRWRVL
ncbi:hypothetical protein RhiJN_16921 [Ceratobasidium sp. AG-Ba]|nr:hypothetical protein RhiJN_16921 [Ceratobasidium sp. AG-Ba]